MWQESAECRVAFLEVDEFNLSYSFCYESTNLKTLEKLKQTREELKIAHADEHKQHFNLFAREAIEVLITRLEAIQQGKIRHSGKRTTRYLSWLKRNSKPSQVSAPIATDKEAT
jgi:hypothetical protein